MKVARDSLIKIRGDCSFSIGKDTIEISRDGESVVLDGTIFAILEVFHDLIGIEDGLAALAKRIEDKGTRADALALVGKLLAKGMFETGEGAGVRVGQDQGPFRSVGIHIRMLNDVGRTDAYRRGLEQIVGPDDVVLDIGTGSGILAAMAAKAGARHVYAVEKSVMKEVAEAVFRDNGIADAITTIRGNSNEIELPEPATVLVSEIVGNDPFDEGIMETYSDALKRHLVPGARVIPNRLECYLLPVELGPELIEETRITEEAVRRWKDLYSIDFGSMRALRYDNPFHKKLLGIKRGKFENRILGQGVRVATACFEEAVSLEKQDKVSLEFSAEGQFNGIIIYHKIQVADGIVIDGDPQIDDQTYSWTHPVYFSNEPVAVQPGTSIEIEYDIKDGNSVIEFSRSVSR